MNEKKLRAAIVAAIEKIAPRLPIAAEEIFFEKPKNEEFGDFATNIAFKLGPKLKKPPQEIAILLEDQIPNSKAIGGFLNFKFSTEDLKGTLEEILKEGKKYGNQNIGEGRKVQVEFISANPTGPLTLGNGRGGYMGDVLANLLAKVGWKVEREYYVNDGGNQVRILGESILFQAGLAEERENLYRGQYIADWAKENEKVIERLKEKPEKIGQLAARDFLEKLIKVSISKMGIRFDNWFSEAKMVEAGEVETALEFFQKKNLTLRDDGALWFKTTAFSDQKDRVLVKSDGEKTYFANDAAYHWDKFEKRDFTKVINIWGTDHHGYVGRLKAAVAAMDHQGKLEILLMQLVRLVRNGQEYKMSKRAGTYVTIDDLFEMIGTADASDIARYFFVSRAADTHMDFDLDLARDTSEKNPVYYVKYAYARISGIISTAEGEKKRAKSGKIKLNLLKEKEELDLVKILGELPQLIQGVATSPDYPIHKFTYFAYEVAEKFHRFYQAQRVITDDVELTQARLVLVDATKLVLEIVGQDILGIKLPQKM